MTLKKSILFLLTIFFISTIINSETFYNKNHLQDNDSTSLKISSTNRMVEYLIITTDNFETVLEPLAIWKTQKGVVSKIELISDITQKYSGGDLTEKIKNCIFDYYNHNNTQWVLLAGDNSYIPTKYIECDDGFPYDGDVVCCDSYYGDINNDWSVDNFDYNMEIFVGRLTAINQFEMQSLVQRILNYEKNPLVGSWMTRALFAGAILQFDQDWNNDNLSDYSECDANRLNNYINNTLLPCNWSSTFLAQTQGLKGSDYHTDAELDYSHLKNAIDQGYSINTIFAHGRSQRMSVGEWIIDHDKDTLFDYTDDPVLGGTPIDEQSWEILFQTNFTDLQQQDKLAMYYLGSCSVGTFDDTEDCVAEYFLKNVAIGCVAGSYVVWGEDQWYERDHGGWFVDGLGFRFLEQLFKYNQPGKALAYAKADYVADRRISSEPNEYTEWGNKTLKQFNLLGDPEIPIWLNIPKSLNVSVDQPYDNDGNVMILKVTADEIPVQNATITYTEDNNLIWKGKTNDNGTIEVPFSQIEVNIYVFTASKIGYLPFQANFSQDTISSSIIGFDILGISLILLFFIGIVSIHYKYSQLKNKPN